MSEADRISGAQPGALVADAATMGFHRLCDRGRIAALAGDAPEFRAPNAADCRGPDGKGLGYFAHVGKRGRSIPIGAVPGACFAGDAARDVPAGWLARIEVPGELVSLF